MTSISVAAEECTAFGQRQQAVESFPGRDTNLGALKILGAQQTSFTYPVGSPQ